MIKLYRCAMCDKVIPINELRKANEYNERYCNDCHNFLEKIAKQWRDLRCQ